MGQPKNSTQEATPSEPKLSKAEEEERVAVEQAARSLRDELVWCVSQLDAGLLRHDVAPEQERESMKVKKILLNPKTMLVKKRCSMNLVFGDYRRLMKIMPQAPDFMVQEAEEKVDEMIRKQ